MIPSNAHPWEPDLWKTLLRTSTRSLSALLEELGLANIVTIAGAIPSNPDAVFDRTAPIDPLRPVLLDADPSPRFALRVPAPYLARMRHGDPHDPLLRQVLPLTEELQPAAAFVNDPLAESGDATLAPGLIKKYAHRALVITTGACAIHCRYCFRRHFPYEEHRPAHHRQTLAAIAADTSITEVIFSGGDPLTLPDDALARLLHATADIAHVKRIRLHTRLPVVLPERTTGALLETLATLNTAVSVVVHANHAQELSEDTHRAFNALRSAGVHLFNQTVLLAGVNDCADRQVALAERLFDQGAVPYYLHMPDRVAGTHHFYVGDQRAAEIYRAMQARLPGYLLPRLVREIPGDTSKRLIPTNTISEATVRNVGADTAP